jgi:diacylglycerol O-acyltransferase / wax synthase
VGSRRSHPAVDRLGSLDRIMLGASRRWPQDIGAIAILDGPGVLDPMGEPRMAQVRAVISSRLHVAPRLRQVIVTPRRGLGGPVWTDAEHFDIRDHVLLHPLPPGTDESDLLRVTEELRREPMDASRPLWRMWLMPGLAGDRVALYVKLHHTIADGVAAMTTIAALLDRVPDAPTTPAPPWSPAPPPSSRDLLADELRDRLRCTRRTVTGVLSPVATGRRIHASWPALRELIAEEPATATSLDRLVGPDRSLRLIRLDLDRVTAVAHEHGATVNDVLLALTSGGLRALLQDRGERVEDITLRTYVPVSLRARRDIPQQGNLIAQMAVPLPMRARDPFDELRDIAAETTARKQRGRTALGTFIRGRIASRLLLFAVMRQRVNLTTASIRGPTAPLYLCGSQVLEVFPVLPLIANEALGVGALSYAGRLGVGIVADPDVYPDLAAFQAGAHQQLRTLGLAPNPAPT